MKSPQVRRSLRHEVERETLVENIDFHVEAMRVEHSARVRRLNRLSRRPMSVRPHRSTAVWRIRGVRRRLFAYQIHHEG